MPLKPLYIKSMSIKQLVIVESPAKAKTIGKYLGADFVVKSSFGHVRDLPKKGMSVDIANNFEPSYEVSPDKKKTVAELRATVRSEEHTSELQSLRHLV